MTEAEELELLRLRKRKALAAQAAPALNAPPTQTPSVSEGTAFGRGAVQGATLGFGDEINGLVQALGQKFLPESLGGGGEQAQARTLGDLYRENRGAFRRENAAAERDQMPYYLGGNVLSSLPLAIATGGGGAATLKSLLAAGAGLGAVGGLGASEGDLTRGEVGQAAFDTGLGGVVGLGASALGAGVANRIGAGANWLSRKATEKAARAATQIDELAKASAGEATASARSAAGTSATAAYKNATNIEEAIKAGALSLDDLTPDELSLYRGLLRERAQKAARDLASDAARKSAKGAEYSQALATEGERAAEAAGRIGNPWNQVGPRLRRYGLPALGNVVGGALGYGLSDGDPIWSMVAMGLGGAAGGFNRPMQHALRRMVEHPSVQRPVWNTLGSLARGTEKITGAVAPFGTPAAGSTGRALSPEVEAVLMSKLAPLLATNEERRGLLAGMPGGEP